MNKLTVATFNIDKDSGDFPNRIYELSNTISKNEFDIICLQEDYNSKNFSSGKFLNLELDYNYVSTKTRQKKRNGILSSSNLTILSKHKISLICEIYFNKGEEEERSFQVAEIEFDDRKVILINTHLCHLSSVNRNVQIDTILKKCVKFYNCDLIILCGDFNALPSYPEIDKIKKADFKGINKEFTHKDKVILDYIFYKTQSNIKVESEILFKNYSDHHCLMNAFEF